MIFGIFPLSVADIIIFRFFDLFTQIDVRLFRLLLVQGLGLGNLRFPFVVIVSLIFQYRVLHEFVLHKGIQLLRIELQNLNRLDQFRGHGQLLGLFNC